MRLPMPLVLLLTAVLASTAAPALGQTAAPADDPNAIVEELVVTARYPGPAFWRVSDGDSEVWILAVPNYIPNGFAWDKSRTQQVLKGANALILPSIMSAGLGESVRFAIANRKNFNTEGKRTLDQVLPAPVIAHYEQLPVPFQTVNIKTSTLKPIFAGLTLIGRTPKAGHWTDPDGEIIALAKKAKVKIRYASVTSALPVAKAIMTMPDAEQSQCFDGNVASIDHNIKTIGPMANAWADGRTSEFLRGTKATDANACIYSIGEVSNMREKAYQAEIKTIKTALDQPGKTLMITGVRPLVAQNGILARLKAEGLTVRTPAD